MKFVLLYGPQAVGKMTVGQELEKITDLKLFHNHMTIDLVAPFFSYGSSEGKRLVGLFRKEIFEAVAKSDLGGMIFTFVWALDVKEDWNYVEQVCNIFREQGSEIYYVELEADFETRLERNVSPHRLQCKPTKRDTEFTNREIRRTKELYRLNSYEGEIPYENYIKINNTNLEAKEVASIIKEHFSL